MRDLGEGGCFRLCLFPNVFLIFHFIYPGKNTCGLLRPALLPDDPKRPQVVTGGSYLSIIFLFNKRNLSGG